MSTLLSITTSRIQLADGKFDSLKRYLRAGSSASSFPILKGKTFYVGGISTGGYPGWRWSSANASRNYTATGSGASVVSGDPTYTTVKIE